MIKMKKFLIIMLVFLSCFSLSISKQKNIIEKADLLMDISEYEAAIKLHQAVLSQHPQQRDIRNKIGLAYYKLENINEALRYIKEELELFPDNEKAYDLLVYILYKSNILHQADILLEKLDFPCRSTEDNPHIGGLGCFILGMHHKQAKRYSTAKKYFRKAINKEYDLIKCYVQLIDIGSITGELEGDLRSAVGNYTVLKEATVKCGLRYEFHFVNGLRYFEKAKSNNRYIRRSIEYFKASLKLNPFFKEALFNLGGICYNIKDYEKASEYFKEFCKLEPENSQVKFYSDCCLNKLGKSQEDGTISEQCPEVIILSRKVIDKPEIEYKHRVENNASSVLDGINNLGLEFVRSGKFQQALKCFSHGLAIRPMSPKLNFNIGMVYTWLEKLNEAEKHFLIALRQRYYFGEVPGRMKREMSRGKGGIQRNIDKIPLSDWTFEVALKEGNFFADAYNSLGTLYFKKKEYDKSILAFKKVIEINREDAMGQYNLGCAYWAVNDWRNAEKKWKTAIRNEVQNNLKHRGGISEDQLEVSLVVFKREVSFRARKCLGRLYLEKNLPDKALKEFKKAIELEPNDPEPYYEVGKIYEKKSESNEKFVQEAIYYYEKYIYFGGENEAEVKKILRSLK